MFSILMRGSEPELYLFQYLGTQHENQENNISRSNSVVLKETLKFMKLLPQKVLADYNCVRLGRGRTVIFQEVKHLKHV